MGFSKQNCPIREKERIGQFYKGMLQRSQKERIDKINKEDSFAEVSQKQILMNILTKESPKYSRKLTEDLDKNSILKHQKQSSTKEYHILHLLVDSTTLRSYVLTA